MSAVGAADADVIVVGAGHNGLVCAAYLARAGLDVLVLEARDSVGGCASTVDALGARVNICNCDHLMVRATGILQELDLASHGLRYIDLEPGHLALVDGMAPWFAFHDRDRTLESLRICHPDQVDGYRRYLAAATPVARLLLELTAAQPNVAAVLKRLASRDGRALGRLVAWSRLSAEAVLRRFFTSDAVMAPIIATGPAVLGAGPDTPGTGLGALGYAMRHLVQVGRPVGGSGSLPGALAAAVTGAGGRVRTGARVAGLACEGRRVRGVTLASGEELQALTVISTVNHPGLLVGSPPVCRPARRGAVAGRTGAGGL